VAVEAVSTVVEAELCELRLLLVGAAKQQLPKGRERRCGPPLGHERYAARRVVEPEGDARTRHSARRIILATRRESSAPATLGR